MKKRLLVVEDNARLLNAIAVCLRQAGYEVMTARNGDEALVVVAETVPDLIVSDVMMPQSDGYSLISALRSNPRTDLIPVVFLTAKDTRGDRLNGIRAGVDAYLVKPFEPEELIAVIYNILNRVARTHVRVARAATVSGTLTMPTDLTKNLISATPAATVSINQNLDNLTEAEERVAALVAKSLSNKEIAAELNISVRTVESHVSHILSKKGWSNRVEIARQFAHQSPLTAI